VKSGPLLDTETVVVHMQLEFMPFRQAQWLVEDPQIRVLSAASRSD